MHKKLSKFLRSKSGLVLVTAISIGVIAVIPLIKYINFSAKMVAPDDFTFNEFPVTTANSDPVGITSDLNGNLWFTEYLGNKISRIAINGVITEYSLQNANSHPYEITSDKDGNIWFTEFDKGKIGKITPDGIVSEYEVQTQSSFPPQVQGITTDGADNIWFTVIDNGVSKIGKITLSGVMTLYIVDYGSGAQVNDGIAVGPDNNIWFTEDTCEIGRMSPDGTQIDHFPATPCEVGVAGSTLDIISGSDSNLWFTQSNNYIGKITTGGIVTSLTVTPDPNNGPKMPRNLTTDSSGNIWFTENGVGANNIGRITPDGLISEFRIPTASAFPWGITSGLDGNIWFTERSANKIGRTNLNTPTPTPSSTPTPAIEPTPTPTLEPTADPSTPTPSPAPTSIPTPISCDPSPAGFNPCDPDLQKGDIIMSRPINEVAFAEATLFGGYWPHIGIYNGDGTITEAYPEPLLINNEWNENPGVVSSPINSIQSLLWRTNVDDWAILRAKNLNNTQKQNAVDYALSKANNNHLYNFNFWDKITQDKFYCSQLVWRSYFNEGVDLDSNLAGFTQFVKLWNTPYGLVSDALIKNTVPPDDIYFSPNVSIIKERPGLSSTIGRWVFRILSPAKLLVTDHLGRKTGFDPATNIAYQEIPGAFYGGKDAEPQFITYRGSFDGIWKFQMKGTGTGQYTFLSESINKDAHQTQPVTGTIANGQTVTYEVNNPTVTGQPIQIQRQVGVKIVPQSIYPSSGLVSLSILGESNFNVSDIDIASLRVGKSNAKPILNKGFIVDINKDNRKDLITVYFNKQTGVVAGDKQLCITGKTKTGQQFKGCSAITTLSKPPAIKLLAKLLGITDTKTASLVQLFLNNIK